MTLAVSGSTTPRRSASAALSAACGMIDTGHRRGAVRDTDTGLAELSDTGQAPPRHGDRSTASPDTGSRR